ncbi:SDR family NAD(P)-dependent oxidoreductase [Allorhizocola rhizosphaerae]|uniref:SDR family NAD(P)-dependent oxidoreductase n=1 Tax=Allorhizocola rhizosphaerae TaxID=1872709 RepID=UPI000E3D3054|nr:SDR family NAD(P)-dependent oxidoreductase [Allorhizocola rhizosphaerae]
MSKVAFVTGSTSGIGLACAETLGRQGFAVFGVARSAENVASVTKQLREEGITADGCACDVSTTESVQEAVGKALETFGRIDVLVNNAGTSGGGEIHKLEESLWLNVINTNLNSVFRVTHEVVKRGGMLERGWGRVISIASTGGKQGVIYASPYSASKHGVVGFTKAVGLELAKTGVTVNAVCPGYVETPMATRVRQGYAMHWGVTEEIVLDRFEAKIPLGRYSTPEEVAGLVAYLTTDTAASITAQAINVCGGLGNY